MSSGRITFGLTGAIYLVDLKDKKRPSAFDFLADLLKPETVLVISVDTTPEEQVK